MEVTKALMQASRASGKDRNVCEWLVYINAFRYISFHTK